MDATRVNEYVRNHPCDSALPSLRMPLLHLHELVQLSSSALTSIVALLVGCAEHDGPKTVTTHCIPLHENVHAGHCMDSNGSVTSMGC